MKYYKNKNNEIYAYPTEALYKASGRLFTKITETEALEISNPPLTDIQIISNTLTSILEHMDKIFIEEYEKPIYFHEMGFRGSNSGRYGIGNAILNAASFPNNADTIKLANWRYDCYGKFKEWRDALVAGTVPPATFTTAYIEDNLPKVADF